MSWITAVCRTGKLEATKILKFDIQVNIPDNIITEPATRAEHIVAVQAMDDTTRYVPFLNGKIRDSTQVDGGTIIYPSPARYLYYGKLMVDPETGSSWAREGTRKVLTDKNLVLNHGPDPDAQPYWFEVSKAANIYKWVQIAGKVMTRDRK